MRKISYFTAFIYLLLMTTSSVAYASSYIERMLIESKWKYTYTLQVEANTAIHQATEDYEFFLYFKYNYTYEQYLNGNTTKGTWSLSENELFYSFRNIKKFVISNINKEILILEFSQPNAKGTYQYHFIRVSSDEAPFVKPSNELPDVLVEAIDPDSKKRSWSFFNKKRQKKKKDYVTTENQTYISIELIGGGYYGGVDPVLRDYIYIKNSGRLIKEFKSVNQGLMVTKKDISRSELEEFMDFIEFKNFFNLDRMYDCTTAACQKRKRSKPTPIPLRLAIAHGNKKNVITVTIWGKDETNVRYVDYPSELDDIIDAIQQMAHRL